MPIHYDLILLPIDMGALGREKIALGLKDFNKLLSSQEVAISVPMPKPQPIPVIRSAISANRKASPKPKTTANIRKRMRRRLRRDARCVE